MNSFWNKNKAIFEKRFEQLSNSYKTELLESEKNPHPFWTIEKAKNDSPTVKENGFLLHSSYNPEREAQQTALKEANPSATAAVFLSFGAGYLPNAYASLHKEKTIILIEPDILHFFAAMHIFDWENILLHPQCILAVGCSQQEILKILNHIGIKNCTFYEQKNQTAHASSYFENLHLLIERNKSKENINNSTLERFSSLWLKNSCKNLDFFAKCDGIQIYKNKAQNLNAIVLAAGPSLEEILPYLKELKKRAIIICVDTALRACLRAKVEPDFIILIDPQYWAAQHLSGLASPSSVLITESAAYPSVFHFKCRKIVLCSSFFPLGKYFEQQLGEKGKIEAGGSVATSAWDFAKTIGVNKIFFSGLDLGYPNKKTHIQGSTFEEASFSSSNRISTAETIGVRSLYGIQGIWAKDYDGNPILTDQRMQLFAWWFESQIASTNLVSTYTFSSQNLAIPGIKIASIQDFLKSLEITQEKQHFFLVSETQSKNDEQKIELIKNYQNARKTLLESFENLYKNAKKGINICDKALSNVSADFQSIAQKLSVIDREIMNSKSKDIASLVFPTQKQLQEILKKENIPTDQKKSSLFHSKIIYRELCKAIKEYLTYL